MDRQSIRRFAKNVDKEYRKKAHRLVRFSQKLRPGKAFKTGRGRINRITGIDSTHIYIKALGGKRTVGIPIVNIVDMVSYFLSTRIVERRELEVFHSHNSALFGLLELIFDGLARKQAAGRVLRLILHGVRVFLAGGDTCPKDLSLAKLLGEIKYVLFSYWYIRGSRKKAWKKYLTQFQMQLLLDSGTFSEWIGEAKAKKKGLKWDKAPLNVDEYIDFVKQCEKEGLLVGYFNFDKIGDWEQSQANLEYMEARGLTPIPVYHFNSPIEVLDNLVAKRYAVIGLGGTVGQDKTKVEQWFNSVFCRYPNVAFHGLGVTRAEWISKYPFFTCDSTAWLNARRDDRGRVLTKDGQLTRKSLPAEERVKQSLAFLKSLEKPRFFRDKMMVGQQAVLFA
jgi:hypothetical protein